MVKLLHRMRSVFVIAMIGLSVYVGGCARSSRLFIPQFPQASVNFNKGVYHEVERGETLWRISKTYGVDIVALARVNHIRDYNQLRVGQLVFVPHVDQKKTAQRPVIRKTHKKVKTESVFFRPVQNGRVDILFGEDKGRIKNKGVDIWAKIGSAVVASKTGVVTFNDTLRGMGRLVVIDHQDTYSTVYAHLGQTYVKEGGVVKQGQKIASLGQTGDTIHPVLHFEIRKHGKVVNPLNLLPEY